MAQTVVGVFDSHGKAVQAVENLREAGFTSRNISIFAPDPREAENYAEELGVNVIKGGATGVAAGGILGGVAGWVAGLTALTLPGAGIVIAAGPLAAAMVGAVGGASVGGFAGVLVGLGLPRRAAEEYNRELKEGRTLVFVHTDGEFGRAELAMHRAHPVGLHHYSEAIAA